ncbi:hypothetical protein GGR58DRAFT_501059 [Xylaria digitata]|nr:hypothetical protein GGR58DRAFT_501059 [Xylaria digitata]
MLSIDLSKLSPAEQEKTLNGPALMPPPGAVPNFDNPPNKNDVGIVTNAICLFVTLLVIVLRAYAKIVCVKKLRIEDYLIAPALATYVGYVYCDFWMIRDGGLFVHQWDIRLKSLSKNIYILHVGANLCAVTITILKVSILLEWIRIFVPFGTHNRFYWTSMVVLVLHTLFYIAWIILENLSCEPYRKIWDITVAKGHCIDIKKIYILEAGVNLFANFIIIALPQWTIWTLQMPIKKKIGVILVFAIGILSLASAAFRLHSSIAFYRSDDIVYHQAGMYLSALIEMTCLFLIFCVPAIPKVFAGNRLCAKRRERNSVFVNPRLSSVYRQWQGGPTTDSVEGFTTMVTTRGHDSSHKCQGTAGILRTTEFMLTAEKATSTTEKATSDKEITPIEHAVRFSNDELGEYHKYLLSMAH